MDRPTVEIKLNESGYTVILYKFLTGGELRNIRRLFLAQVKMSSSGNVLNDEYDASLAMDIQDKVLEILVKEVIYSDGTRISRVEAGTESLLRAINELPSTDSDSLYELIDSLYKSSEHTAESKKK